MTGVAGLRRLEQWMTYLRWFGVVFGAAMVGLTPTFPDQATRTAAWAVLAILAIGSLLIWGTLERLKQTKDLARVGMFAFAFDAIVIMSIVFIFAFERPYVTWALLFLIPMEAALRFRLQGALLATAGVAVFSVIQTIRRASLLDQAFELNTFLFIVGMSALVAGVVGTMADNWHAQSLALEEKSRKLAEVDKLKDRFLAVTSHELRGPLTAIIAGLHTVTKRADRLTPEQRATMLAMISSQALQLTRLVEDIQVTSQLQAGQIALQPEWTDLEVTIDQALEAAQSKRRDHQLHLFVEPISCELDGSRVGQIIRNLVENAYKYTPDHTKVSLTARKIGDGVDITVSDAGPGIPPDKRDVLFEAFSRIEETSAGQEGMGLGLYVVSQLVLAMKGRIDLASSSRGTSFTIHLPCHILSIEKPQLDLIQGEGSA